MRLAQWSDTGRDARADAEGAVEVATPDRTIAVVALAALAPLMALIAMMIAATGQAPIFRQSRVGQGGALFTIYKFRSFWEERPDWPRGPFFTARRRLFAQVSGVLRGTGLDELPQLVNILRGDMVFIGPRPLTPDDHAALPPGRYLRTRVAPGITGLAQVNGGQRLGESEKLAFDLYYIDRRSPSLKLRIVALSLARLAGFNAVTNRTSKTLLVNAMSHAAWPSSHAAAAQVSRPPAAR